MLGMEGLAVGFEASPVYTGQVKSWNFAKGFGFLLSDAVAGDIFFGRHELPQDVLQILAAQPKFLEGRGVAFQLSTGPDGRAKAHAVQVSPTDGLRLPGVVKSYADKNGYGFINSSSLAGDVRFDHKEVPHGLHGSLLKDQPCTFLFHQLPDGKHRASQVEFPALNGAPAQAMMAAAPVPATLDLQGVLGQLGLDAVALGLPATVPLPGPRPVGKAYGKGAGKVPSPVPAGKGQLSAGKGIAPAGKAGIKRPASSMSMSMISGMGAAPSNFGYEAPQKMARVAPLATTVKTRGVGIATGQIAHGQIKSYNTSKGFGFITSETLEGDIFFMRSSLRAEGVAEGSLLGCACTFDLFQGADGRLRADNVTPA